MRDLAPFYFVLQLTVGIDYRRIEPVNRVMYLVPYIGFAVLHRLVEAEVISTEYPAEVRRRQHKRVTEHDQVEIANQINITAVTDESRTRAANAIADFLLWDDKHIAEVAKSLVPWILAHRSIESTQFFGVKIFRILLDYLFVLRTFSFYLIELLRILLDQFSFGNYDAFLLNS